MITLKQLGERETIRRLVPSLPLRDDVKVAAGDDAAVVTQPGGTVDWLLTSDPVVEHVHVVPDTPARYIGHKAVGRALSDVAAMGGEPLWLVIDLMASGSIPMKKIEEIYAGASALASLFQVAIVGGDTSEGDRLELHVFGIGRVPCDTAVLRSGAEPGDMIYVTGALGGSGTGKHLTFQPRVKEGEWLRERGFVKAMIDISDGLATDLRHIIDSSRVGAELTADWIPVSSSVSMDDDQRSPLEHALYDGEDYELLFTVSPEQCEALERQWNKVFERPCNVIGKINGEVGVLRCAEGVGKARRLHRVGYEHFH